MKTMDDMIRRLPAAARDRALALSCGPCTACCGSESSFVIDNGEGREIKQQFGSCESLTAKGCGCYDDRPAECQQWGCFWRIGALGPTDFARPDKIGVYVDAGSSLQADDRYEEAKRVARSIDHASPVFVVRIEVLDQDKWADGSCQPIIERLCAISEASEKSIAVALSARGAEAETVLLIVRGKIVTA